MFVLGRDLKEKKACCRSLNKSEFGDIQSKTREALEILETIQRYMLSALSQVLFAKELYIWYKMIIYSLGWRIFFPAAISNLLA